MSLLAAARHLDALEQPRVEIEIFNVDQTIPPTICWSNEVELNDVVFPNTPRFYVQRWETLETSWISPNCAAKGIPRPPAGLGPRACACPGPEGEPVAVYGNMEAERLWTCMADWYDAKHPHRAFAPNIWRGLGPCPSAPYDSVLHRFPGFVKDNSSGREWFVLPSRAREAMESAESLDSEFAVWLFPESHEARSRLPASQRYVYAGAPSIALLHARWSAWVHSLLARRAVVTYELLSTHAVNAAAASNAVGFDRLCNGEFFGACAMGAWFRDTPRDVKVIREFIRMGIPVYYKWKQAYAALPLLADLRPRRAPAEESGRYAPPMSPRQPALQAAQAPGAVALANNPPIEPQDPRRHWNSARSAPVQAIDAEGNPFNDRAPEMSWEEKLAAQRGAPRSSSESPSPSESLSGVGFDVDVARVPPSAPSSLALSDRISAAPGVRSASYSASSRASLHSRMELLGPPSQNHYDPRSVALPARIEGLQTGADWFTVPNPATYFLQLEEYTMDFNGIPMPGKVHSSHVDWFARIGDPSWQPAPFCARMHNHGVLPQERVEMLFRVGGPFSTLLPAADFPVEDETLARAAREEAHKMPEGSHLSSLDDSDVLLEKWAMGLRMILMRPHGRATLGLGGLLARLARWSGETLEDALAGPSPSVREYGADKPVEVLVGGVKNTCINDWLDIHEIRVMYGLVHAPGSAHPSLWPDPEQFASNWFKHCGCWTRNMEAWFVARLTELWNGQHDPPLKTRAQWREELRTLRHAEGMSSAP
ncbi:hypothetical protein AURDEDRAFT_170709 [Auricularia subglabra TFB-10046 SS5]|uniref:Uncharacterized protein n=1 Tax=Auricularia subglabra (strain TFB-10046 / SS5) TaxID=717982 RepID=J0DCG4_AURST|nr:hypothetical protein AURDEDRAFT_170709 [Auricularia subglabra TFB-10046 SS5]